MFFQKSSNVFFRIDANYKKEKKTSVLLFLTLSDENKICCMKHSVDNITESHWCIKKFKSKPKTLPYYFKLLLFTHVENRWRLNEIKHLFCCRTVHRGQSFWWRFVDDGNDDDSDDDDDYDNGKVPS